MNLCGSFRALRDHSVAAMLGAIEIYNKPQFSYRSECFSILAINAWELLLKAILSKNKQRIFYPKVRNKPYQTLGLLDSLCNCKPYFPASVQFRPVAENLNALNDFRNNSVHFYNESGADVIVYGLAQTGIVNFRDLMRETLEQDIAEYINLCLMPLAFQGAPDPIDFLSTASRSPGAGNPLSEYVRLIADTTQQLESDGHDTGRFLAVFNVSLQSTKKISAADITVGVDGNATGGQLVVHRRLDPNLSHPLRQKEILEKIGGTLHGGPFTSHTFQAIVWKHNLKHDHRYSWCPDHGGSTQYSPDVVALIKSLTRRDIETAVEDYRERLRSP